jgi:hypothetical protein
MGICNFDDAGIAGHGYAHVYYQSSAAWQPGSLFFSIEKAAGMTSGWHCHVPSGPQQQAREGP